MCPQVSYTDNLKFANSLDPGQAQQNVGSDLDTLIENENVKFDENQSTA